MEQKKKIELLSLKDVKGAESNPFYVELQGKMYLQPRANTIVAKGQQIVDTTTGEIVDGDVLIGKRKIVDKSQFAKIYASEIGSLYELSKPAIRVFMHLTKVMDYDNKAIFDYNQEYQKLDYKYPQPVLKGLRELMTKKIIYPHIVSGVWWLNPQFVCKGERFAHYIEYVTEDRYKRDEAIRAEKEKALSEQTHEFNNTLEGITEVGAMQAGVEQRYVHGESLESINGETLQSRKGEK